MNAGYSQRWRRQSAVNQQQDDCGLWGVTLSFGGFRSLWVRLTLHVPETALVLELFSMSLCSVSLCLLLFLFFNSLIKKKQKHLKCWPFDINAIRIFSLNVHVYKICISERGQMNELNWNNMPGCHINVSWLDGPSGTPSSVTDSKDVQTVTKPGKECGNKHQV